MDGHAVASGHPALVHHAAESRHEPASQTRRFNKVQLIRQAHEIHVGVRHGHELGESSPSGESRLVFVITDVVIAGQALRADTTTAAEGHGHPVPDLPVPNQAALFDNNAGEFVSRHVGQLDRRVVSHPPVPVASAYPVSPHLDHDTVIRRDGIGNFPHLERLTEGVHYGGFHHAIQKFGGSFGDHGATGHARLVIRGLTMKPE